jgi:carbamoyltransferase
MNVVGISAHYHDSACCVLRDGRLVAAAEEERFSRIKHDPAIPAAAFRWCLDEARLTIADIDAIAYYEEPATKLSRQLWMGLPDIPPRLASPYRLDPRRAEREIREILGFDGPIVTVPHHLSHAASSYYYSGFDRAAILTVDAVGEWATTSYGRGDGHTLELFEEVDFPDSLGLLYSAMTQYLGFEVNEGEYKVMGLASYGTPRYVAELRTLLTSDPDSGGFTLDLRHFALDGHGPMATDRLHALLGRPPRDPDAPIDAFAEDVARSLQVVLEEILLEKVRYLHGRVPADCLCLAGGVALNCVANGRITREGPFKAVFVQPAAGDSGAALGAAALAHVRLTGTGPERKRLPHAYLGSRSTTAEIRRLLAAGGAHALDFSADEDALLDAAVERLAAGAVLGWFHGAMEFGPRALGARSILADPRRPEMRDRINALVKKREAFRPFAPAVPVELAHEHFGIDHASPFMLETCAVTSRLSLPAIRHIDGSARVQTVDAHTSPRFHRLLRKFGQLTGCPILLNTSFNMKGEPIVRTAEEALACFVRAGMDSVVLEDFILDRAHVPAGWIAALAGETPAYASGIRHDVYTLL